jgi:hypothetical protein
VRTSWPVLLLALLAGAVLLSPAASGAPAANPKLFACVGSMDNADAFLIHLSATADTSCMTSSITSIPAGTYDIQVDDYASLHNFHLTDPNGGTVNMTTVDGVEHTTWTNVKLSAGTYGYHCDAHPTTMKGSLTVTQPTGGWTTPFDVSASDSAGTFDPDVGLDSTANGRFVWQKRGSYAVQTRTRTSGGSLGTVATFETNGGLAHPRIAVNASGGAAWIWLFNNGSHTVVHARTRVNGSMSSIFTVSNTSENSAEPQVGIDAGGNAYFVWSRAGGGVQLRIRSSGGTLSAIQNLSPGGTGLGAPQVAGGASGHAAFVWLQKMSSFTVARGAVYSGGSLSAAQSLSSTSKNALAPAVGIDGAGVATYAWTLDTGATQARRRSSGGTLGGVLSVSPTSGAGGQVQVAVEPASGKVGFVWRHAASSGKLLAQERTFASGALGTIKTLSADGADAVEPQIGIDSSKNLVAVWQRGSAIQARTVSSGGTPGTTTDVGGTGGAAGHPALAVAANGKALTTWVKKFSSTDFRIQAAAGP